MQILAQELQQRMQEQAAKVPEADIDKYYKDHPEMFEQARGERAASTATGGETPIMAKPVVVLTGVSGNLGMRLLPLLGRYTVIGVDVNPPKTDCPLQFESLDLGEESSTRTLYELLRDTH